jgi:predicted  nucleic acid-binding Zn-ribbon protein
MVKVINNQVGDCKDEELGSLFSSLDTTKISKPFDKYLSAIDSFYIDYKADSLFTSLFLYYKGFNPENIPDKESKFVDDALSTANYDVNSLKGENVILFSEPVIVSEVNCINVRADDDVNAIRLISFRGQERKFTTRKRTYQSSVVDRPTNQPRLITSYKVNAVIWGIILPKYCDFSSLKATSYRSLHTNQERLEIVQKTLQNAQDFPVIEMENIKNQFSKINSVINSSLDKFNSIQDEIGLATKSLEHTQKNLESSKVLFTSISADIDESNTRYEELELGVTLYAEKLDNIKKMSKENASTFEKERAKLEQITSDTNEASTALSTIKNELVDANRSKNLSNYDMVGHSDETVKQTRLYYLLALLVLSGLLWVSVYVYQNGEDFIKILPHLVKVSAWDILLSRLPLITATTLIIGGLSGTFFFLVKHIVSLNTEKMTMLKAAILAEQITNSLDCKEMTDQEKLEFTRETKIKLIMQVFVKNEPKTDQKNLIIDILKAVGNKK